MMLSLCFPYYRNAGMLLEQMRVWSEYPADLKAQIEVIVIDDGSPEPASDVLRPSGLPPLTIGRLADVDDPETPPWRQDAARNRAAHEAVGSWLFLSDIDHVLPVDSLRALLQRCEGGPDVVYTFGRLDAPDLTPKLDSKGNLHPHPNTYAMQKSRYWSIGGYDEDFCGIYGTDGPFRKRLVEQSQIVHLAGVPIVRYARTVIADASTRCDRNLFRENPVVQRRMAEKRQTGAPLTVLSVPWTRQVQVAA